MRNTTPSYSSARVPDAARTASLVAAACVLQIAESLIPNPVPGVRLGLANMVTLVTMAWLGPAAAIEVAVLRTVVSSLVLGSFLTPGFILSFSGAVASTAVMCAFWSFSSRFPRLGFSVIGVSVASAAAHNAAQLCMAYLLIIKHPSVFYFAPWLTISAVAMGWVTGLVAVEVLKRGRGASTPAFPTAGRAPSAPRRGYSYIHRLAPEWKIAWAAAALLAAVVIKDWRGFLALAAAALALMFAGRLERRDFFAVMKKLRGLSSLALIAFVFPLLFSRGEGAALFSAGPLEITRQGFLSGSVFALRIFVMGWIGFLLNLYASPDEMAAGIRRLFRPFSLIGVPVERFAAIIGMSWAAIPEFMARAREAIAGRAAAAPACAGGWKPGALGRTVGLVAGVVSVMCASEAAPGAELDGGAA